MKVLSVIEKEKLLEQGIIIDEWLGGGATSDVFSIKSYKNQTDLCIKYMWDARKKDVEAEYERYKRLYRTEPRKFAKVVDLIWIDVPDEDEAERCHHCAILVMEKLQKIRKANHSIQTIVKILYDVAACLGFMHILSIYHRDIKLDNVMYCRRTGTYILIDYGISAAASGTFTEYSCKGTLNNIAPECLKGKYSNRSEFYSLGMMVREWFVGHELTIPSMTELNGASLFDCLYEEKARLKPLNEDEFGCPELIRIINKLTQFDREKRYPNYRSLIKAIKGLVSVLDIDLAKTNQPSAVYMVAVNENNKNSSVNSIRKIVNQYLAQYHVTNSIIQVFPFSQPIYTRLCNTLPSDIDEVEIIFSKEDAEETDEFLTRIRKIAENNNGPDHTEYHVCIFGAKTLANWFHKVVSRFKDSIKHAPLLSVAYRMVFSDSYAVDVSDYEVSEVTVVNNVKQLQRCCDYWFGSEKEVAS